MFIIKTLGVIYKSVMLISYNRSEDHLRVITKDYKI